MSDESPSVNDVGSDLSLETDLRLALSPFTSSSWSDCLDDIVQAARSVGNRHQKEGRIPGYVLEFRHDGGRGYQELRFHVSERAGGDVVVIQFKGSQR